MGGGGKQRPPHDKPKGPDKSAFYAALLLISIPIVLFFVFVCPYLAERLGVIVIVIPVYVCVVCLANLFIASAIDPGVIPRSDKPPNEGDDPKVVLSIKGKSLTVRWCTTCCILRPPRASHCPDCDRCVEKFDHHCPWVGNCIGKRNYRFFVMFLCSCTFLCAYVCGFSILRLVWLAQDNTSLVDAVLRSPISLILAIYSFFIFWSVGGLFAYHQYLTAIALTTHEEMKSTFSTGSPYSDSYTFNCLSVWCPPCYPSIMSFKKDSSNHNNIEITYDEPYNDNRNANETEPLTRDLEEV
eukprot:Phypoly_transcript_09750.p1 GENE.Phypoly_transcript_09750~~Phypoly_transcript_09750.p1  ORF type:complete len:298 (+),score=13.15 Phypoly_transcript_09750:123-1016(+)